MTMDHNTLAGTPSPDAAETPSTECDFKEPAEGGSPSPVPAIDASVKEAEEGPVAMEAARARSRDVGFSRVEPSTESEDEEEDPPALSEEFRQRIAKCISNHGKVLGEIHSMRYATAAMVVRFEREAAVETANQICNIVNYELNPNKF